MSNFSHFSGRITQVIQALDVNDAVSNQVVNLDRLFRESFGLTSEIYAASFHPQRQTLGKHLDLLEVDERDIVIYHYSGFARESASKVIPQKAVKILHYHNITPHEFFPVGSDLYQLCKDGREQLAAILDNFDLFTGDSQYNLDELASLGISRDKTLLLPILIDTDLIDRTIFHRRDGDVVFVGRIAENKRQDRILETYGRLLAKGHALGKLVFVGRFDPNSPFYRRLCDTIQRLKLYGRVRITGQISGDELHDIYSHSGLFLSMSEHEGFGVPLLEACRYDIPVLALAQSAVPETLRQSAGLFRTDEELERLIELIQEDAGFRDRLLSHQRGILANYKKEAHANVTTLLNRLIPLPNSFKSVSIVVCTFNRGALLDRALEYLQRQHDERFEVIVVDGPSTDDTPEVIDKWRDRIKFGKNPQRNLSMSRNIGIRLAAGQIVAFIDDDALPFDDWVSVLLSEYNSVPRLVGGIGGITYDGGTLEFQADDILIDSYGRGWFNQSREEVLHANRFRTFLGTNASFRRDMLLEIGGFDEEYDYFLDESDLCVRALGAGFKLLHSRQLFLRHELAQSDNRRDKYRYNWYSICKNTAYFALRFNKGNRGEIIAMLREQIQADRVTHLERGLLAGVLMQEEFEQLNAAIWRGLEQGIRDAQLPRLLLNNAGVPPAFHPYLEQPRSFVPLHCVLVSKEFPPFTPSGGVGTLYYHLASELLLMGHQVSVIAQGPENSVHRRGRFTLYRLAPESTVDFGTGSTIIETNLNWSLRVAKKILQVHRQEPISVLDSSIWDSEMYAFAVYGRRVRIPTVVRLVTPFAIACESNAWEVGELEKNLIMELERGLVQMSDGVIPISRSIDRTFRDHYGLKEDTRWRNVPAGIAYWPTQSLDQNYLDISHSPQISIAKQNGKFIFLFLSRLEFRKGVDILLAAARLFITRHWCCDNYLFVLAGKDCIGIDRYLDSEENQTVKDRSLVLGEISVADREKLYNVADVLVFPSRYESFGLVPLEAFVYGKPVIGSDAGAIPEVVEHNRSGLLFEDGNADGLAECFDRLLHDRQLYGRLAEGARKRVRELSSANMAQQTESVYCSITQNEWPNRQKNLQGRINYGDPAKSL